MADKETLVLEHPVETKRDGRITELSIRTAIKGRDLEEADLGRGDVSRAMRLLASLAGIAYDYVLEMSETDLARAFEIVAEVKKKSASSKTGATS